MIDHPQTSRTCSDATREVLRRAREPVDDIPISDRSAFALLQAEMGHDVEALREKFDLDARQMAVLRARAMRAPPVARGKGTRKKSPPGKPHASYVTMMPSEPGLAGDARTASDPASGNR